MVVAVLCSPACHIPGPLSTPVQGHQWAELRHPRVHSHVIGHGENDGGGRFGLRQAAAAPGACMTSHEPKNVNTRKTHIRFNTKPAWPCSTRLGLSSGASPMAGDRVAAVLCPGKAWHTRPPWVKTVDLWLPGCPCHIPNGEHTVGCPYGRAFQRCAHDVLGLPGGRAMPFLVIPPGPAQVPELQPLIEKPFLRIWQR